MTRKKKEWPDALRPCKKFNICGNQTHFAHWTVQSSDTLRRQRLGLCGPCWDELKESDEYDKLCEKMGWSVESK